MDPLRMYRRTQVEGADGARLVVVAYDGAIAFIERARLALDEGRRTEAAAHLLRAQRVVLHLASALDLEASGRGDVAANLHRLNTYVLRRLAAAAHECDRRALGEALHVLRELRPSWARLSEGPGVATPRASDAGAGVSVMR